VLLGFMCMMEVAYEGNKTKIEGNLIRNSRFFSGKKKYFQGKEQGDRSSR